MRALWLADVLRAAGLKVYEDPGWKGRGKELRSIKGVVAHHTATGTGWTDERVDRLLRDGRTDLPGPLSQLGLDRQGRYRLIASGRANHNGYGTWGNDSIGIEAYNAGDGRDPWPAAQLDAYQRGCAAILAHLGLPAAAVKGHKETDPRRKVDPRGIDMATFRARVAALLTTPTSPPEDDDTMTPAQEAKLDRAIAEAAAAGMRCARLEEMVAKLLGAQNIADPAVQGHDGKDPYPVRTIRSLTRIEAKLDTEGRV